MKNKRGFTLVEVMVVVAIFFIIGGAILATLTMGRKSWHTGNVQVEVQQNARLAMDAMVRELRQVKIISSGASVTFNLPIGVGSGGATLWGIDVIEYLKDDADINGDGVTDQILRRIVGGGGNPRVIANNISSLSFTLLPSAEEVEIELIASKRTLFNYLLSVDLASQVTLRN